MKFIKFFTLAVLSLFIFQFSNAAVPKTITFQGVLTGSDGKPASGVKVMVFNIYSVTTGGNPLFTVTKNVTVDTEGLYSVELDVSSLAFDTQYWLGVNVASDGEMTPRFKITSAGYAVNAAAAETATLATTATTATNATKLNGQSASYYLDYANLTNLPPAGSANIQVFEGATVVSSPTARIVFNASHFSLTESPAEVSNVSLTTSPFIGGHQIADSTITAADLLDGAGSGIDADLLDGAQGSAYMQIAGSTVAGNLFMDTNRIKSLAYPLANTDAASKQYVDDQTGGGNAAITDKGNTFTSTNTFTETITFSTINVLGTANATTVVTSTVSTQFLTVINNVSSNIDMGNNSITNVNQVNAFDIGVTTVTTQFLKINGMITGDINMNQKRISNLPAVPLGNNEAASKQYVDNQTGGGNAAITDKGNLFTSTNVFSQVVTVSSDVIVDVPANDNPVIRLYEDSTEQATIGYHGTGNYFYVAEPLVGEHLKIADGGDVTLGDPNGNLLVMNKIAVGTDTIDSTDSFLFLAQNSGDGIKLRRGGSALDDIEIEFADENDSSGSKARIIYEGADDSLIFQTGGTSERMQIFATGEVGIGNVSSASEELHVNGDVTADSYKLNAQTTHYYSISAPEFNSDGSFNISVSTLYLNLSSTQTFFAPVHLPDNAEINEVIVRYFGDNGGEIFFNLKRTDYLNSGAQEIMASDSDSPATSGYTSLTDSTISNAVIDNETYNYVLEIKFVQMTSFIDLILGARIRYLKSEVE